MTETQMGTDEILASIRQMLSDEVSKDKQNFQSPSLSEINDIFILTPEMRCDASLSLQEKMQRVLNKMNNQTEEDVIKLHSEN